MFTGKYIHTSLLTASTGPKGQDKNLDTATFEVFMGEVTLTESTTEGLSAQLSLRCLEKLIVDVEPMF